MTYYKHLLEDVGRNGLVAAAGPPDPSYAGAQ
jgi:hypothetical protein